MYSKQKNRFSIQTVAYLALSLAALLTPANLVSQEMAADDAREQLYAELAEQAAQEQFSIVRKIVKATQPSVVHIEAKKNQKLKVSAGTADAHQRSVIEEAGSGVVLQHRNQTFVVTNYHVVEDSDIENIRIEADGRFFYPTRIEHDSSTDLSVLFTDQSDLDVARIGNNNEVQIGDFVVAVGSPFGLSHSVSYGIISAKGRRDLELGPQGVRFQDFLQTDAAINPGNSGGPLINLRGEVIGINTAIASNSGGSDGIGFSIPIQMVMRIARDLIDYGEVRRGFLGVSLDSRYSSEKGRSIGLDLNYGTRVSGITPESPAEVADFQVGVIILEFGGVKIASDSHLVTEVSLREIGNEVPVKIFRAGKIKLVAVKIQNRRAFDPRD